MHMKQPAFNSEMVGAMHNSCAGLGVASRVRVT